MVLVSDAELRVVDSGDQRGDAMIFWCRGAHKLLGLCDCCLFLLSIPIPTKGKCF